MPDFVTLFKVSLVSKDSSMLDGLDNASIEMEEAKVCFAPASELHLVFSAYTRFSLFVLKGWFMLCVF